MVDGNAVESACRIKSRRRRGLLCRSNASLPLGSREVAFSEGRAVEIAQIDNDFVTASAIVVVFAAGMGEWC